MTRRGFGFLGLTLVTYLIANYTRVGWVYVICAGLLGVLLLSWLWRLLALRGLRIQRPVASASGSADRLDAPAPCEGDAAFVELAVSGLWVRQLLVRLCDPLLPGAPRTHFLPMLRSGDVLRHTIAWDRRGVHAFPPVAVETAAPFGLFSVRREADSTGSVLVYPRWWAAPGHPAPARPTSAAAPLPRVGAGGAFFGVREYRQGDPARHIHWRSSLRRSRLTVKEFEDEAQPALTIVLDASTDRGSPPRSSFEDAVRLAASALHWGLDRGILVTLVAPDAPRSPVTWRQGMEFLAHVATQDGSDVGHLLTGVPPNRTLLVLTPQPNAETARALAAWRRAGAHALTVHLTGYASGDVSPRLQEGLGLVRCGPSSDLAVVTARMTGALAQPARLAAASW
ncbi:MAG: DUF58 domain-containing protein [Chloroflexi bacterium]|nr:DUF58 domain-containing protein [Chloroflexota bacterium]